MFDSNKKIENRQFVIVFNDETEKIANYLYNKLYGTIDCVLWTTKEYKENVPKIKNTNKILVYDEDLIKTLLPYPEKENITNLDCGGGAKFIQQGSRAGLVVNISYTSVFKDIYNKNKYFWTASEIIPSVYEFFKLKKEKRELVFKDATDEIMKNLLLDFIKGKKESDC